MPSEDFDEDPAEWNEREGGLSRDLEDGFGVYRDSDDEAPAQAKAKGDRSEGEHRSQAEAERETLL